MYDYDVVILDINLVTGSAFDILSTLKKGKKDTTELIISANNSLENKLEGLDHGADYLYSNGGLTIEE